MGVAKLLLHPDDDYGDDDDENKFLPRCPGFEYFVQEKSCLL